MDPLRITARLIEVHSLLQQPQPNLESWDAHSVLLNLCEGALVPESQQLTFQISCFMKAQQEAFISCERVFAFETQILSQAINKLSVNEG